MPRRLQRRRTRGFRLPPGTVCVSRPSRWGNPYRVEDYLVAAGQDIQNADPQMHRDDPNAWLRYAHVLCVAAFRTYAVERAAREPGWLAPLRGRDLACFCPEDVPCHADVLLELANTP